MHRLAVFVALALCVGCGKEGSVTSPTPVTTTATTTVAAAPPFTGRFTGSFQTPCVAIGELAIAYTCNDWTNPASPLRTITLDLTQSSDLKTVTGSVSFGANRMPISSGTVDAQGRLLLEASGSPSAGVTWVLRDFVATLNGTSMNADWIVEENRWGSRGDRLMVGGRLVGAPRQ